MTRSRHAPLPLRRRSGRLVVLAWGVALVPLLVSACASAPPAAPTADTADVEARAAAATALYARDVVLLESPDFVRRSNAAERLVAAGSAALPAIGEAGEAPVHVCGSEEVSATRPVLRAIFESLPDGGLSAYLASPWATVRQQAANAIGRRGGRADVPALIGRMDDDDVRVRAAAAVSLRRLTNRFFGYDARAGGSQRQAAIRRWREWWTVEGEESFASYAAETGR